MPTPTLKRAYALAKMGDQAQVTQAITDVIANVTAQEFWVLEYAQIINFGDVWTDMATGAAKTAGMPQLHYCYNGLIVTGLLPKRRAESPMVWEVQVTYSGQYQTNPPAFWNVQLSEGSDKQERPATQDANGNWLVNVNGETLPQLPNTRDYVTAYNLTFQSTSGNTSFSDNWSSYRQAKGKVNSDAVNVTIDGIALNYAAGQIKLEDATRQATRLTYTDPVTNATTYVTNYTYTLQLLCWEGNTSTTGNATVPLGNNTWQFRTPNSGWQRRKVVGGVIGNLTSWQRPPGATDDSGTPVNMPAAPFLLNGDGTAINPDGIAPPTTVTPVWLPDALDNGTPPAGAYQLEPRIAFSGLLSPFADP